MLAQAVKPLVRLVDRYLPDPYIFVLILTLIVMVAAMAIEGHAPTATLPFNMEFLLGVSLVRQRWSFADHGVGRAATIALRSRRVNSRVARSSSAAQHEHYLHMSG